MLGQNSVGKEFLDTSVINWWWNSRKSSKHKSMFSQILCCASERFFNIPNPTKLGRTGLQESDPRKATEIMMQSTESRLNSSGTSSQDSQRCSAVIKSLIYWAIWDKHQQLSQEEFYFCQCSMTSLVTETTTKMNVLKNADYMKTFARRFGIGQWSFIGPGSEKNGILPKTVNKEFGTTLWNRCCWNLQKVDILFSVQRLHCPGVVSRAKGDENCLYTSLQIKTQLIQFIALFFLSISSVPTEQWQLYAKNLRR